MRILPLLVRRDDSCGMERISKLTIASKLGYIRCLGEQPVAPTICWNGSYSVNAS